MKSNNIQREVLNCISLTEHSNRYIGRMHDVSHNTVKRYRDIYLDNDLNFEKVEEMDDGEIENLLNSKRGRPQNKHIPDWSYIHTEMQKKFMTLQFLYEEYEAENQDNAYCYSQFVFYYREYEKRLNLSMRQNHPAGECIFVDFAGQKVSYFDTETNKKLFAQIFIGVLGCSNYTFAYAVRSQSTICWIECHNKMYHFFGGVSQIVMPDNLKAAVINSKWDPKLNRTYRELAKHYRTVIVPARVRKPKDKAKAEVGVLIFSRWIFPILRRYQFFSIEEINAVISEHLIRINERQFKNIPSCRRARFEALDKPLLGPLPETPFEYAEWTSARKVTQDYHLPVDKHHYSVPHELVGHKIETRATNNIIEFFHKSKRVASHLRSHIEGGTSTLPEHQPKNHRHYASLTPEKLHEWAKTIGPGCTAAVKYQFESKLHAALGIKACSTLKSLEKQHGHTDFEAACKKAKKIGSLTVKSIRSILQNRLSKFHDEYSPIQMNLPLHENLRGSTYYE